MNNVLKILLPHSLRVRRSWPTAKRKAAEQDESSVARHGFWTSMKEIRTCRQVMQCKTKIESSPSRYQLPSIALQKNLTAVFKEAGLSAMLWISQEVTNRIRLNDHLLPQLRIQLPALAYVAVYLTFNLQETWVVEEAKQLLFGKGQCPKSCKEYLRKVNSINFEVQGLTQWFCEQVVINMKILICL